MGVRNTPFTRRAGAGITLASLVAIISACGARGPLDDDSPLDAGATLDALLADVGPVIDSSPPPPSDAAGDAAPSVVNCATCLVGECGGEILKCIQATGCRTTLQCAATTCLGGGSPDAACLFKCASGDVSGTLQIFQIFQCIVGKCGADCNAVLGGVVGGIGGGRRAQQIHPFAKVLYSRWPELSSH